MSTLTQPAIRIGIFDQLSARSVVLVGVLVAVFAVYWFSSSLLLAAGWDAMTKFSADTGYYSVMAEGDIHQRVARFHPLTVAMAVVWLKVLSPLTLWISPIMLLKAMFATVGALGVWAAMWAFSAVVPRRLVLVCGLIYAASFGVWYFSSIEESKIVTASLTTLYIAYYLHLRDNWTARGALVLTGILLLACVNEIVSGLLIIIPFVDMLVRQGWDWRQVRWIVVQGLTGLFALVFLEVVVNGLLVTRSADPEGASHFSHFFYYLEMNDYREDLYGFVINWLLFNIAAPSPLANYGVGANPNVEWAGEFAPALLDYLTSPVSAAVAVLGCLIIAGGVLRRFRPEPLGGFAAIHSALLAYALVRGAIFMVYLVTDPLVNSPPSTLAHLLIVIIPFAVSRFPAKQAVLAAFAALLVVSNSIFFFSQ